MHANLTPQEQVRYSRHLMIPGIGESGQLLLKNASVLLIGTGALGSPAALYLAAAGVGRIGLVDPDVVDASNLQRQVIHGESWIGQSKLKSASARIHEMNPHIHVECHPVRFSPENALHIAQSFDVIIDGSDNFQTRFLTNDVAFLLKIPLIYGAIHRFEGQTTVFAPHRQGPCYRCLLPDSPAPGSVPSCHEAGVLGVLPGIIGSLQAMEAIKWILQIGNPPLQKLTVYNALESTFRSINIQKDPHCQLCGKNPTLTSLANPQTLHTSCSLSPLPMKTITTQELRQLLQSPFDGILIDVREPHEHQMANIDGARLIPLATLPDRINELPTDQDIYIHCKMGMRSARAVEFLMDRGFTRVANVSGGIDAWLNDEN